MFWGGSDWQLFQKDNLSQTSSIPPAKFPKILDAPSEAKTPYDVTGLPWPLFKNVPIPGPLVLNQRKFVAEHLFSGALERLAQLQKWKTEVFREEKTPKPKPVVAEAKQKMAGLLKGKTPVFFGATMVDFPEYGMIARRKESGLIGDLWKVFFFEQRWLNTR